MKAKPTRTMGALSCAVAVRYSGGAYIAGAGRGKTRATASSTSSPEFAARRCAAKFFGLDESTAQGADDIKLEMKQQGYGTGGPDLFLATLNLGGSR